MIDDITYLIENQKKIAKIVYIDSTLRDKRFIPIQTIYYWF
jgi:hypothetical protein